MADPKNDERREGVRITMVAWPASYAFDDDPAERLATEIQDFSPAGAFVAATRDECERLIPGRRLTLHGEMWGTPFSLPAEVRWVGYSETHERFGFGVSIDRDVSLWRLLHGPDAPNPGKPGKG
ncbi:MAG: PilZ domain-containing protein [Deltaproteobacteria bacterium]|nr:PilZ domain-containing protein [Planctomycetaceae bacterium]MCB9734808.1 PilZ domain-containing protein [Deltaproteobacteria bacterium]